MGLIVLRPIQRSVDEICMRHILYYGAGECFRNMIENHTCTHIMANIFATLLCASAFFPCFINRFVNRSNIGSTFGGSASSA